MPIVEIRKSREILFKINDNECFSEHLHKNLEMLYILEGEFWIAVDGKEYLLQNGDICLTFPFCLHRGERLGQNRAFVMIFDTDSLSYADMFRTSIPECPILHERDLPSGFRENVETLCGVYADPKTELATMLRDSLISVILAQCVEQLALRPQKPRTCDDSFLVNFLMYCSSHYTDPSLSLESAAAAMFISKYHLSRLFSSKMYTGFKRYITLMRIESAMQQLLSTEQQIGVIAAQCGFRSVRTFNRDFAELTGMTPRDYRKRREVIGLKPAPGILVL